MAYPGKHNVLLSYIYLYERAFHIGEPYRSERLHIIQENDKLSLYKKTNIIIIWCASIRKKKDKRHEVLKPLDINSRYKRRHRLLS